MRVSEYRIKGFDTLSKVARGTKKRSSAIVYVPIGWSGRRVQVILLDDPDEPAPSPEK